MKAFEEFFREDDVSGLDVIVDKLLPFVHTNVPKEENNFRAAKKVLQSGKLEKNFCKVFLEELLYFYYARPVYRKEYDGNEEIYDENVLRPVVFIIKPACVDIKRAHPFDTGGFKKHFVDEGHLSKDSEISDYEMPNTLTAIQQYVKAIFGNNWNYCHGKCKSKCELPNSFKLLREKNKNLDNLLNLISIENKDGRCKTVELQTAEDVDFTGKLLAIVFPLVLHNDPEIIRLMDDIGAEPCPYSSLPKEKILDDFNLVDEESKKYYIKYGYMEQES
jgi:hypothetical protein